MEWIILFPTIYGACFEILFTYSATFSGLITTPSGIQRAGGHLTILQV